ncbi:MAG: hypothetical protein CL878_15225 [Dehalococcoidia bacterium]|nr:hypothetical protein [Dehalococcoidia bacterium]
MNEDTPLYRTDPSPVSARADPSPAETSPPTVDLAAVCLPAEASGRAAHDFIDLGEGRVAAMVATAQGHGQAAAFLATRVRPVLRTELTRHQAPAPALSAVNRALTQQGAASGQSVAAACVVLDTRRGTARIAAAGAPPPLLRHLDGEVADVVVPEPRFALGMVPELQYEEQVVRLALGETLLLASSEIGGVSRERLRAKIADLSGASTGALIDAVAQDAAGAQSDDLAILALRWVARAQGAMGGANLPRQLTSFIGREHELDEVGALLRTGRLLTLTGPGGTGKTRLAIEAASAQSAAFSDGVHFVDLSPVRDSSLVVSAIAEVLGIQEAEDRPLLASLKDYLREKLLLLVLDSFERATDAAPVVVDLLAAEAQLKVMVTSRVHLEAPGEHVYAVRPLALPDPEQLPSLAMLSQAEAVALFIQRAQSVEPGFAVTQENAPAVAGICAQVEGLPLALELAAARLPQLSPQTIREHLEAALGGQRQSRDQADDAPSRERTLRGAIAWSHDLLPETEQTLFRRLAVFVGGCTPAAAQAVGTTLGEQNGSMQDEVRSLVAASLLRREGSGSRSNGESRVRFLETIREYGHEQLVASGEQHDVQRRHAWHYVALAEAARSELLGHDQLVWLARLEVEHDNLRAALQWAIDHGEAELGLRLGGALWLFWWMHSHLTEGRAWLVQVLSLSGANERTAARALVLAGAGQLAWLQDDTVAGETFYEEGLAIYQELDDQPGIADALRGLGMAAADAGDTDRARALLEQSLALSRQTDDVYGLVYALACLAYFNQAMGNAPTAQALWEEALPLWRRLGNRVGLAVQLRFLGELALARGESESARNLLTEGLGLSREVGHKQGLAYTLRSLASVVGDHGDHAEAGSLLQESLQVLQEVGDRAGMARALEGCATLAAAQEQPERVLQLAGAAAALREEIGIPAGPNEQAEVERVAEGARETLSQLDADAAWALGQGMTVAQTIAYVLDQDGETASDGRTARSVSTD